MTVPAVTKIRFVRCPKCNRTSKVIGGWGFACSCGFSLLDSDYLEEAIIDTDNDRTANQYAQTDNINHPEHYSGTIECIDAMIAAYGKEQVAIFCKICAFKYLWRLEKKGDSSIDAGKAQWYLDKYKEMKR